MKVLYLFSAVIALTNAAPASSGEEVTEPTIVHDEDESIKTLIDDEDDLIIIRPGLHIPGFNLAEEAGILGFPFQFPTFTGPSLPVQGDPSIPVSQLGFSGVDLRDVFGQGTRTGGEQCDTLCQLLALFQDQAKAHVATIEKIQDKENEVEGDNTENGEFDVNNSTYNQKVLPDGTVVHQNRTTVADADANGNSFFFTSSVIHNLPTQRDLAARAATANVTQDAQTILDRSERDTRNQPLRIFPGGSPPNLEDDIRINLLLMEDEKRGGLRRLEPHTELVTEDPPGSGNVIPILRDQSPNFAQREQTGNPRVNSGIVQGAGTTTSLPVYGFNSQGEMVQQRVQSEPQQQANPFQQQANPFQQQANPFQQQISPFQPQDNSFQQQTEPFLQQPEPFRQQAEPFQQQRNLNPFQPSQHRSLGIV